MRMLKLGVACIAFGLCAGSAQAWFAAPVPTYGPPRPCWNPPNGVLPGYESSCLYWSRIVSAQPVYLPPPPPRVYFRPVHHRYVHVRPRRRAHG